MLNFLKNIKNIVKNWFSNHYNDSSYKYLIERKKYKNWLYKQPIKKLLEFKKEAISTKITLFEIYKRENK